MIKLSTQVNEAIEFSRVIASNLGHAFIGTEHLLLALLGRSDANNIISRTDFSYSSIMDEVVKIRGKGERASLSGKSFTKNFETAIVKSSINAYSRAAKEVCVEDVLHVLFTDSDFTSYKIIKSCSEGRGEQENKVMKSNSLTYEKISSLRKETPILNGFSRDLTLLALEDKLDPVIERDDEINRIIQILLRKNKNNPCLVGNPGVGKSAIADGLAYRIIKGQVPDSLREKRIVALDISSLLAGAKYRGDFEERLNGIFNEVKKSKNVILMIDEIHNIVNTGAGEGTLDAANILKPELARGDISIIGATTFEEYSKTIEKDGALDRRFQKVPVEEPSAERTVKILIGLKSRYEQFHKIKINDDAIVFAVQNSLNIPNKYLPDKAIDVIDECCALVKMQKELVLTKEKVKKYFEVNCFINQNTNTVFEALSNKIVGQSKAIKSISELVQHFDSKLIKRDMPLSMLFIGPTGCGKTAAAKELSNILFGENSILKIDMGEYSEKHSVSKLIGAPPGYVGYEDRGLLVGEVIKKPNRVILFDEIEKAHSDVLKLLLNLLDDGVMRDVRGRTVSFRQCIFIMTTGLKNKVHNGVSGFIRTPQDGSKKLIKEHLGKEICGRIDGVVEFDAASYEHGMELCRKFVADNKRKCMDLGIDLNVGDDVINEILNKSEIINFGYRNIEKNYRFIVEKEINKAFSSCNGQTKNINIFVDENKEISYFTDFKKINLENNKLSMYNRLKSAD